MKKLNGYWVLDGENDNGISNWSPEEWQNHMAEFTVEWFLPNKTERNVCLDIGSNIGQMAIGFSKYFKEIHTFEPCPEFYECLQKNLVEFNVNNVTSYNRGLSDVPSTLWYKMKYDRGGTSRFMTEKEVASNYHLSPNQFYKFMNLQVDTLDSYEFKNVDLIKIDVEGWEKHVIRGASKTIAESRPIIVAEWKHTLEEIDEVMLPHDYVMMYKRRSDWYYVPREKAQWIVKKLLNEHPHASHFAYWRLLGL